MPVSPETFRAIVGSFPAGVTIVTALGRAGEPCGMTSTAFCSISLAPPIISVCVDRASRTLAAIQSSGGFVVNFLADGEAATSDAFASKRPDKFAGVDWIPSRLSCGAPILTRGVVAHAECRTIREIEAGDHILVIASVEGGRAVSIGKPLVYFRRAYPDLACCQQAA